MREQLLEQAPMRLAVERAVEGDDRSAALETVADHLELVHRVRVEDVEARRRSVGRPREPHVELAAPPRLEVDGVVAGREVGELIDLPELVLGVELGVCARSGWFNDSRRLTLLRRRQEGAEVVHQMSLAIRDTARREDERLLAEPILGRTRARLSVLHIPHVFRRSFPLPLALARRRGNRDRGRGHVSASEVKKSPTGRERFEASRAGLVRFWTAGTRRV